jgi:hypothetical protein
MYREVSVQSRFLADFCPIPTQEGKIYLFYSRQAIYIHGFSAGSHGFLRLDFSCELTVLSPFIFVSGNRVITVLRRRTCVLRVTYAIYTSKPRIRTRTLLAVTNRHPSVPHAKRTQSSRGPEWQFFGDENKRRKNRDYLQKNRVHKYSASICMGIWYKLHVAVDRPPHRTGDVRNVYNTKVLLDYSTPARIGVEVDRIR